MTSPLRYLPEGWYRLAYSNDAFQPREPVKVGPNWHRSFRAEKEVVYIGYWNGASLLHVHSPNRARLDRRAAIRIRLLISALAGIAYFMACYVAR